MLPLLRKFQPHHLALAGVVVVALLLRGCDLGDRPMHADEANQAVKLGELLEGRGYWFDPHDHHGPTLYYFARPVAWVCGKFSLAALTESSVRLTPALFGTIAVLLTAGLAAPLGRLPMVIAAAFVAVAPGAVYFSRYFIQETLLLTFLLGALLCGREWLRTSRAGWALALGACAGLMQATKASALFFALAALIALWVEGRFRMPAPARLRGFALALFAAIVVAGAFYSSFGQNPSGIRDALTSLGTMVDRATDETSGHEKPGWYYGWLLTHSFGARADWRIAGFLLLALVGYFASWRSREPLMRFLMVYATIITGVLSFVPYKTPWIVIHIIPPLAIFAAFAYVLLMRWRRIPPGIPIAAVAWGVLSLAWATSVVAFSRPADERNPYAYVHAVPDVQKVRPLVQAALAAHPDQDIKIISEEYWPLPWYLRGLRHIGYWTRIPEDCDGSLVIVSADMADAVRQQLHGDYTMGYLGLRPGFVLVVFSKSAGTVP